MSPRGPRLDALGLVALAAALVLASATGSASDGAPAQPTPTAFRELQLGYLAIEAGDPEAAMGHYAAALERARGDEQRFNALLGLGSAAL
ncbi:MAG TPA: hypothetical protein VLT32_05040, partial [Candidatus Sulfomarinibacteraceae bacterium]|nr:hypothetical protein [Candidatus Sulfomarinibacteraceae bacterium]